MNNSNLDSFVAVPISTELYLAIAKRSPAGVSSLIEYVVWDFLDRTGEGNSYSAPDGIEWSNLFLPEGTKLRVSYRNEYKYAEVVKDKIVYEGEIQPSISKMASIMRNNTTVNAWKHVEVKRPADKNWILADVLRRG